MTKPVEDYFDRRMADPTYAAAFRALEAEYEAERNRIRARIEQEASMASQFRSILAFLEAHPELVRVLDMLKTLRDQEALLAYLAPARQLGYVSSGVQISSEADYGANVVSTEVSYNVNVS